MDARPDIHSDGTPSSAASISESSSFPRTIDLPDYTVEQFKKKFKDKDMATWLQESQPFNYRERSALPNNVEAYLLKGANGEKIRYRQSIGASQAGVEDSSCVSIQLPEQSPSVGFQRDGSLEIRQTAIKWTYVFIVNKLHYFLYHIDTTDWDKAVLGRDVLFYYQKDHGGHFQFKGEMTERENLPNLEGPPFDGIDYCTDTY